MKFARYWITGISLVLGVVAGASQYWPELSAGLHPDESWELGEVNQDVLENTADLESFLALQPPRDSAPAADWVKFIKQLDVIKLGKHYRNSGVTSPLLTWYAYAAKHRPDVVVQMRESEELDGSKFNHLIRSGFLADWYKYAEQKDEILLSSSDALIAYAVGVGIADARAVIAKVLLSLVAADSSGSRRAIDLEVVRFAAPAMTTAELNRVVAHLASGNFNLDSRDVKALIGEPAIDRNALLSLVRKHADSHKSMSSYMTTGAQLGALEYVEIMAGDIKDNADQPTNFYCSACGLAIVSDGLIGPLVSEALDDNALLVSQEATGSFVLQRSRNRPLQEVGRD